MSDKSPNDKRIWKIIFILCMIGACIALIFIAVGNQNRKNAEDKLALLTEQANKQSEVSVPEEVNTAVPEATAEPILTLEEKIVLLEEELDIVIPRKNLDFAKLHEETNKDIYAWIHIQNTVIDYPVVQHPTDNLYYLNHNLDGSKGYPGCIYSEDYNTTDFTDVNTVLYGHNMKDGSMFAGLHNYEDSLFFEENPYVFIYTEDNVYVYKIFAAYEAGSEHILVNYGFNNKTTYQQYLDNIMNMRTMNFNLRKDAAVNSDSQILTLSTCIANKPNNRYLVQGVLLNPASLSEGESDL